MRLDLTIIIIIGLILFTLCSRQTHADVTLTAYSPTVRQTDNTPRITAFNIQPVQGWTIAISWDLFKMGFNAGDKVYIYRDTQEGRESLGVFQVQDLMNQRWEKRVDIFFESERDAYRFGIKEGWKIAVVDL